MSTVHILDGGLAICNALPPTSWADKAERWVSFHDAESAIDREATCAVCLEVNAMLRGERGLETRTMSEIVDAARHKVAVRRLADGVLDVLDSNPLLELMPLVRVPCKLCGSADHGFKACGRYIRVLDDEPDVTVVAMPYHAESLIEVLDPKGEYVVDGIDALRAEADPDPVDRKLEELRRAHPHPGDEPIWQEEPGAVERAVAYAGGAFVGTASGDNYADPRTGIEGEEPDPLSRTPTKQGQALTWADVKACPNHGADFICDECSPPDVRAADLEAGKAAIPYGNRCTNCGRPLRLDAIACNGAHHQAAALLIELEETRELLMTRSAESQKNRGLWADVCDDLGQVLAAIEGDDGSAFLAVRKQRDEARAEARVNHIDNIGARAELDDVCRALDETRAEAALVTDAAVESIAALQAELGEARDEIVSLKAHTQYVCAHGVVNMGSGLDNPDVCDDCGATFSTQRERDARKAERRDNEIERLQRERERNADKADK